ncbi:tetratricopeptide (TPR) repeat protein [Actinokineospora baliensis]|uniref:FxSxx-COOH system tetratricopeptide repeat protein n=1 Tax=Actinokineospora baliensis TaxID=547056 RepID=UPI001956D348|nr:FxSxx-COOH system tetratricopeptide repeat protein [Actinokineospora baliensis]MBM7772034.1 tetratricopeptide (TPR) repeat protein [Actinokineospora baliensis]
MTESPEPGDRVANTIPNAADVSRTVQSGSIGGDVLTGGQKFAITAEQVVVAGHAGVPAMESVAPPRSASRIPATRLFLGRSAELARLDAVVGESGRAVVVAVHGLGGVGKSTLAARFAALHADRFSFTWWVVADSPSALTAGLAEVAAAVAPGTRALPLEERAELGVRWLASHDDWLLVLDNLTGPAEVADLLARVRTGTIIITSRLGVGWHAVATTVAVDVLPAAEAVALLSQIVLGQWPDADLIGAEDLCEELGHLPLAVEQAAAYLAQTRISPTAYLDLLSRFPARMFAATTEGSDAQRTMARVWHVTLDHLADTPLAGQLLHLIAWWSPDTIPRDLFSDASEPGVHEALGRLAAYSMITLGPATISVHRLVQAVTRTPDPADPHRHPDTIAEARDLATFALATYVAGLDPLLPANWHKYQAVLPHAQAVMDRTAPEDDTEDTGILLSELGGYLDGQDAESIAFHRRALDSRVRIFGPNHSETLAARNNLAYAHFAAGAEELATTLFSELLVDCERELGSAHLSTLMVMSNLAGMHRAAGEFDKASPLLEAVLAARERLLGPEHPHTLEARNNMAEIHWKVGDRARGRALFEANLADRGRVLGLDHPDTLVSRNNLAEFHRDAGELDQTISLLRTNLAECKRTLGPDHPLTLLTRNNLAGAYRMAGAVDRSLLLFEAALADRVRVSGPDHPHTLTLRNNLAGAYRDLGDLERAISLYEDTLSDATRVLGADHRTTRGIRNNLNRVRGL